jgi:hypothetical protein
MIFVGLQFKIPRCFLGGLKWIIFKICNLILPYLHVYCESEVSLSFFTLHTKSWLSFCKSQFSLENLVVVRWGGGDRRMFHQVLAGYVPSRSQVQILRNVFFVKCCSREQHKYGDDFTTLFLILYLQLFLRPLGTE